MTFIMLHKMRTEGRLKLAATWCVARIAIFNQETSAVPKRLFLAVLLTMSGGVAAPRAETFSNWPLLKSTFPSTGGGGITIKGYDPVITADKCVTTFMAVTSDAPPQVYPNVVEFDAVAADGGTLCTNGRWRSFDGGGSGTTPYRIFFKDGVFRGSP